MNHSIGHVVIQLPFQSIDVTTNAHGSSLHIPIDVNEMVKERPQAFTPEFIDWMYGYMNAEEVSSVMDKLLAEIYKQFVVSQISVTHLPVPPATKAEQMKKAS